MEYNKDRKRERKIPNTRKGKNMAKATVKLICATCGQSFEISKICYNRTDANNWEAYMSDRDDCTCSECYKKAKQAECEAEKQKFVEDVYSKLPLPQIEGVSEKQVKYAEDLRIKFVRTYEQNEGERLIKSIYTGKFLSDEKRKEIAQLIRTETSARKIIDALKNIV